MRSASHLDVSVDIYPVHVIFRACYSLIDKYHLFLEPGVGPFIRIHLTPKRPTDAGMSMTGELEDALLDYAARWTVALETRVIREALLTEAFRSIGVGTGE